MTARFNPPPFWQQYLPANFTPAPGWTPEASWGAPPPGWALWTSAETGYPSNPPEEYRNNPYLFISVMPGIPAPAAKFAPAEKNSAKKPMGKGMKILIGVVGVLVFIGIIGSCGNGGDDAAKPTPAPASTSAPAQPKANETPTAEPVAEPEPVSSIPKAQQSFSDRVAKTAKEYQDTDNELRMSKAITDRDKALCKATGGTFEGWKATIHDIGSTGDGYGYVAVIVEDDIELSTWNNAFSDIGDNTLIKPSNKVFDALLDMDSGDAVTVSGTFIKENGTCVKTSNVSETFNADSPDFKVTFSSITADK